MLKTLEDLAINLGELAAQLREDSKRAASILKERVEFRLKEYWPNMLALELVDLAAPNCDVMPDGKIVDTT